MPFRGGKSRFGGHPPVPSVAESQKNFIQTINFLPSDCHFVVGNGLCICRNRNISQ